MNVLNNIVVIESGMAKYQYFLFKVTQTHLICKKTQWTVNISKTPVVPI